MLFWGYQRTRWCILVHTGARRSRWFGLIATLRPLHTLAVTTVGLERIRGLISDIGPCDTWFKDPHQHTVKCHTGCWCRLRELICTTASRRSERIKIPMTARSTLDLEATAARLSECLSEAFSRHVSSFVFIPSCDTRGDYFFQVSPQWCIYWDYFLISFG